MALSLITIIMKYVLIRKYHKHIYIMTNLRQEK